MIKWSGTCDVLSIMWSSDQGDLMYKEWMIKIASGIFYPEGLYREGVACWNKFGLKSIPLPHCMKPCTAIYNSFMYVVFRKIHSL